MRNKTAQPVFPPKGCTFNHLMCHYSFDTLPDKDLLFTAACCIISVLFARPKREGREAGCVLPVETEFHLSASKT